MGEWRRVLVVDDEADLSELLEVYLARHEIQVLGVGSVAAAMAMVDRADVLLTDFLLPDGDGVTLVEQARARRPGLPAVVMSALVVGERCTAARVHLVPKPFALQHLASVLLALASGAPAPTPALAAAPW